MKKRNHLLIGSRLLVKNLLILLCLIPGCSKQDLAPENLNKNLNGMDQKNLIVHQGTIQMVGFTRFAFYVTKEDRYITDGYTSNFLECKAELTFSSKMDFTLSTKEYVDMGDGPFLYREVNFQGKMTPSGQLNFNWPETWTEMGAPCTDVLGQIGEHTGMDLSGQGVSKNTTVYKGSFDGNSFFADMNLIGKQKKPGTLPFLVDMVDGPVKINFMIDLEVVDL